MSHAADFHLYALVPASAASGSFADFNLLIIRSSFCQDIELLELL
jgi:hypothetical protein